MSQEVYFGEVDCRRLDRLEALLEEIATKLGVLVQQPITSDNTPAEPPPVGEITPSCKTCSRKGLESFCEKCDSHYSCYHPA